MTMLRCCATEHQDSTRRPRQDSAAARSLWTCSFGRISGESMAKRGRPSKFSKAIADEICRRLADGESLRTICAEDAMPDKDTVRRWLRDEVSADFHAQYARAREEQADSLAEEAIDAARAAVDRDTAAAAKVQ